MEQVQGQEKIMRRIFAVLQMRNSPNEQEAQDAAARAAQMLAQYNLTEEQVLSRDPNRKKENIGKGGVATNGQNHDDLKWIVTIGGAIARMCFCKDTYTQDGKYIYFTGTEVNMQTARQIFTFIVEQVFRLTDEEVTRRYTSHRQRVAELAAQTVDRTTKKKYSTPEILDAAALVLREKGPLHHKDLVEIMAERGMALPTGEIVRGVWARIMEDIKKKSTRSRFRAPKAGWFEVVGTQTGQSTVKDLPNVKQFKWSFMCGMFDRVALRLIEGFDSYISMLDKQSSENSPSQITAGTALVKKHQDLINEYLTKEQQANPHVKVRYLKIKQGKSLDTGAYRQGYDEGEKVELTNTTKLS